MSSYSSSGGYVSAGYVQPGYVESARVDIEHSPLAESTIQSQYSSKPRFNKLIHGMAQQLNPKKDIELFFRKVFDISQAEGWGLDNWGRILGLGRIIEISAVNSFGFAGSGLQPFNQAAFDSGGLTRNYQLTDEAYRKFLMLKAASNISNATIPTINRFMSLVFKGRGDVYVLETGPMQIQYTFKFILEPWERTVMNLDWMIPRPGCVSYTWVEEPIAP